MYSRADRIRAVELYLKLGKRSRATIRQLGYPTKNALKGWCREYEQQQDLRVRCAPRSPKYYEAEKRAALEHYRTHDRCIASTIKARPPPPCRHGFQAIRSG
jgi:transposase-like protein